MRPAPPRGGLWICCILGGAVRPSGGCRCREAKYLRHRGHVAGGLMLGLGALMQGSEVSVPSGTCSGRASGASARDAGKRNICAIAGGVGYGDGDSLVVPRHWRRTHAVG